jgi:hypothetical protein
MSVIKCYKMLHNVTKCWYNIPSHVNLICFLFSFVSDFFATNESDNANVGTTTAFDEQLAQSGTAVHSNTGKRKRRMKQMSLANADGATNQKLFQATLRDEAEGSDLDTRISSHTTSQDVCPLVVAISYTVSP